MVHNLFASRSIQLGLVIGRLIVGIGPIFALLVLTVDNIGIGRITCISD
jgi:hypothetical protein